MSTVETTTPDPLDTVRAADPGVIWHQGLDPITDRQPAWRASHDATDTHAIIRVGGDAYSFDTPGYGWDVTHGVFEWGGYAPTLEQAIDEATDRLVTAYAGLMLEGY